MYQIALAGSSAVMQTQSRSATPEELITSSGIQPSAHSASRTGHKSGKTLAGDALSLCLYVCVARFGLMMFIAV
jgi:hypothetical protein